MTRALIVPGHFSVEGGKEAVRRLLERHPDVDGIFAGNDLMAIGALKALQRMGIKVPDQVSICGFDGVEMTEWTEPELTTVAQPIYEMGAGATRYLIDRVRGKTEPKAVAGAGRPLIQRGSTRRGAD